MGLNLSSLRFIAREHRRRPFAGKVLTLGRQCVYATESQVLAMLREEQIVPAHSSPMARTNIPSWRGTFREEYVSDVAFFSVLGVDSLTTLDISDHEKPDVTLDLGIPLGAEHSALLGSFDLVLDGGTTEHVFDISQALTNLCRLLRPGGRILHMSPASNYVDHGFYSMSPTLFFHFYGANEFEDCRGWLVEHSAFSENAKASYYAYDPGQPLPGGALGTKNMWAVFFFGTKTERSTGEVRPTQGCWSRGPAEPAAERPPPTGLREFARRLNRRMENSGARVAMLWRRLVRIVLALKRGSFIPLRFLGRF